MAVFKCDLLWSQSTVGRCSGTIVKNVWTKQMFTIQNRIFSEDMALLHTSTHAKDDDSVAVKETA